LGAIYISNGASSINTFFWQDNYLCDLAMITLVDFNSLLRIKFLSICDANVWR